MQEKGLTIRIVVVIGKLRHQHLYVVIFSQPRNNMMSPWPVDLCVKILHTGIFHHSFTCLRQEHGYKDLKNTFFSVQYFYDLPNSQIVNSLYLSLNFFKFLLVVFSFKTNYIFIRSFYSV